MHQESSLIGTQWQKASFCSAENGCVETAHIGQVYAIRDGKNPLGPVLLFNSEEWTNFLDGVKAGEFDYGP
jgi:hypothetical protein